MDTGSETRSGIPLVGAIAAFLVVGTIVADIAIGSSTGSNLEALPRTAVERFEELNRAPWLGLYHLDLLNALAQALTIPVYVALALAHRGRGRGLAALGAALFLVASAVFLSTNVALPMLQLAREHAAAGSEAARAACAAAGAGFLAKGAHGTLAAFQAFGLVSVAGFVMALAMVRERLFPRLAGWAGVAGNVLLFVYLLLVTFLPGSGRFAMALAMPGGLLALAWIVLVGVGLLRLRRATS